MNTVGEVLQTLRTLKSEIRSRYNVREIGLFGSFVHGRQGEASDVDLLVDFEEEADLFDLVGLAEFLEKKVQRKVDLVSIRALRQELRDQVLKETVMV